jgi:hypothetical protein
MMVGTTCVTGTLLAAGCSVNTTVTGVGDGDGVTGTRGSSGVAAGAVACAKKSDALTLSSV